MNLFGGLRGKIIGLTLLTVVVFMSSFLLIITFFNRARTLSEFEDQTARMGELIAIGLENGMLERNLSVVRQMVGGLSEHTRVKGIYIINKNGEIKISSSDSAVGRRLDIQSETCQICHRVAPKSRGRSVVFNRDGERVFRTVTPIANKPACYSCHPSEQKLNGVLISDFSMEPFDREMRASLLSMVVAVGVTMTGLAGVIWILMNRLVLQRLGKLLESVRSISTGDLTGKIPVKGTDEISELEQSFNKMSSNLRDSMDEIKRGRESLANLLNSIEDEIIVIDRDYRIVNANRAALARMNIREEDVLGRLCHEACYNQSQPCADPERDCPIRETLKSGTSCSTYRSFVANNEKRHFEQYVSPVRNEKGEVVEVVKISRDVTRRRKLEEQLVQSERLISLGQLAAGVAHQINNPVGIIVNRIDCLNREINAGQVPESLQYDLDVMMNCAWRVNEITRSLLTFSRETPLTMGSVDVNKALITALDLARMQPVEKNISFESRLSENLPAIKGDVNKLEQCFVNILNNAVDAIPDEGWVRVESHVELSDGPLVQVKISDNGGGIAPENLGKIFDPFFTTKTMGKGTGLGLSISYGTVRDHDGRLEVSSVPGVGTTFTISLPVPKEAL